MFRRAQFSPISSNFYLCMVLWFFAYVRESRVKRLWSGVKLSFFPRNRRDLVQGLAVSSSHGKFTTRVPSCRLREETNGLVKIHLIIALVSGWRPLVKPFRDFPKSFHDGKSLLRSIPFAFVLERESESGFRDGTMDSSMLFTIFVTLLSLP